MKSQILIPGRLLLFSLVIGISSASSQELRLCGRTAASIDHLEFQLRREEAILLGRTSLYKAYKSEPTKTHWLFTLSAEPAHPAIACTRIGIDSNGATIAVTDINCFGEKANCDLFRDSIEAWHREIERAVARQAE